MNPLFILSSGRSGTKFMSQVLNIADGLAMKHEMLASFQQAVFAQCPYNEHCDRSHCDIRDTAWDKQAMNTIKDAYRHTIAFQHASGIRFGEASSHLPFLLPYASDLLEGSDVVLLYRNPYKAAHSATCRGKWKYWFGNLIGRCRYCNVSSFYGFRNLTFAENWLLLWVSTWEHIMQAIRKTRDVQLVSVSIEHFTFHDAFALLQVLDLSFDEDLLLERFIYADRNSSFGELQRNIFQEETFRQSIRPDIAIMVDNMQIEITQQYLKLFSIKSN